jgi:hypothetical protein
VPRRADRAAGQQFTTTIAVRISESSAQQLKQLAGGDCPDDALGGGGSFLDRAQGPPGSWAWKRC